MNYGKYHKRAPAWGIKNLGHAMKTRKCQVIILASTDYIHLFSSVNINPYPTAFPYGNSMVLHFYQQQESSTTKTVHKVINKRLKTYV